MNPSPTGTKTDQIMGNGKKLKSKDGATRIAPMPGGDESLYSVQYYDGETERWRDVAGLYDLTWEQARTGRRNYVAARNMVRNMVRNTVCNVNRQKIHAYIGNK